MTTKQEVQPPYTLLMDLWESEWLEKVMINNLMFISLANALASQTSGVSSC